MELAGYTHRVATMMVVFEDCSKGVYKRLGTVVKEVESKRHEQLALELKDGVPVDNGDVEEATDGTIVLDEVKGVSLVHFLK